MKFIVITGGVLSGLGKGITASSIGRLLISRGYKVSALKIDPYLNCDAGTMNPFQHGEVFVLDDGGEVDLDLGNYERFLDVSLTSEHNITTGKVYKVVIEKERRGDYLGKTVQIIPHITTEIKKRIKEVAKNSNAEVLIIEVGGTIGDIESLPFLEAIRQLRIEIGSENFLFVHTTLIPIVGTVGEQKTKPTQHSVKELRAIGINPDIIVGRGSDLLSEETREKISLFCDVPKEGVVSAPDLRNIYEVPIILDAQNLTDYMLKKLNLEVKQTDLNDWKDFVSRLFTKEEVKIAIVGKYVHLKDSYLSIIQAFYHAGAELNTAVKIVWVEAEELEKGKMYLLDNIHGILVPGGFGNRGIEGKILAINHARENKIPFLGICLGFQLATIEYCRNVLGLGDANSSEFTNRGNLVIDILPEQRGLKDLGGTMRLGSQKVIIEKDTLAYSLYNKDEIHERHRHRYEVNPEYITKIENAGLHFSAKSEDGIKMEILELKEHPYFIASQFHPEFKSRPRKPSPLFFGLVENAKKFGNNIQNGMK